MRDFRYVVVLAAAIWAMTQFVMNSRVFFAISRAKLSLAATVAMLVTGAYGSDGARGVRSVIGTVIAMTLIFIGCQMARRPKYNFYWGAIAILGLFTFVAITTNNKLAEDAWAARAVVRNSDRAAELMNENIGGYTLTYFASALCPTLLFLSLRLTSNGFKQTFLRIIAVATFLVTTLLIFRSGYGLATISSMFCCLIIIVPGKVNKPLFWSALIIAGATLFVLRAPFFDQAKSMTKGGPLFRKVLAIEDMSNFTGLGDGDSEARIARYSRSLNSFFESPLVGTLSRRGIGNHSSLLDAFARYGLFGGLAMLGALFLPLYQIHQAVEPANKKLVVAAAASLLVHAGLNNLQAGSVLAVFIFMPFAIREIRQLNLQTDTDFGSL